MKYMLIGLTAALLGAFATAQAAPPAPAKPLSRIAYGIAYGECMGYCDHSLIITAQRMRLVHKAFLEAEKYPQKVLEKPTRPETWQKLLRLASFQTLKGLPDRIGCPDCTDGGAEWIELQQDAAVKRVTFEPQAGLRQQAALLAELRKLYQELDAKKLAS